MYFAAEVSMLRDEPSELVWRAQCNGSAVVSGIVDVDADVESPVWC